MKSVNSSLLLLYLPPITPTCLIDMTLGLFLLTLVWMYRDSSCTHSYISLYELNESNLLLYHTTAV